MTALSMNAAQVWNVSEWTAADPYETLDNNGLILIPGSRKGYRACYPDSRKCK